MKKISMKGFIQKILIALTIVILLYPDYSFGSSGGKLIRPINDFLIAVGDNIMIITQKIFMPDEKTDAIIYENDELSFIDYFNNVWLKIPGIGDITSGLMNWMYGSGTSDEVLKATQKYGKGNIKFGPATIFSNKIKFFDINFFNPIASDSAAGQLRIVVSKAYNVLRTIAIVGLLSVLVYIGIRIIINSSSSSNQAKYKNMLLDWLIALCMLFLMHYMMSGLIFIVNKINDIFQVTLVSQSGIDVLFSLIRDAVSASTNEGSKFGYIVMYYLLITFTLVYAVQYLKRVIYMAFLTMIAPLVAFTYPIDKMNDGKAQAFDMWFKEYIFNLLIQPLHIIIYYVLISSAYDLAIYNPIYGIVAIGFMFGAEKLMRRFFGFEKAQTPGGLLGGPAGTAIAMSAMNSILGKKPPMGPKKNKGEKGNSYESDDTTSPNIKYKDNVDITDNIMDNSDNDGLDLNPQRSLNNKESNNPYYDGLHQMNYGNENSYYNKVQSMTDENNVNNLENRDNNTKRNVVGKAKNFANKKIRNAKNNILKKPTVKAIRHYTRGIANKKPINKLAKKAVKVGTGVALGSLTGVIGFSAGMATGDLSKAIQYTTASAVGGYKMGSANIPEGISNVASNTRDALKVDGTSEVYYGKEEYKEKQIQKNIKEVQKNYDLINKLEKDFGIEEAKNIKENIVPDCVRYGITDANDISAIAHMEKEGIDRKQAIAVANDVNSIGKSTAKLGAKDSEDLNKTLVNRFKAHNNVKNDAQAENLSIRTRKLMDKYSKIKYK